MSRNKNLSIIRKQFVNFVRWQIIFFLILDTINRDRFYTIKLSHYHKKLIIFKFYSVPFQIFKQFNMKVLLLLVATFWISVSFVSGEAKPFTKLCPSCSSPPFGSPDSNCYCVFGSPIKRKYACGPACDAIGLCCDKKIVDPNFDSQF